MAPQTPSAEQRAPHGQTVETPYLAPIEKPHGLRLKLLYRFIRRQFGTVPGPFSVFVARMPLSFGNFFGKVSKLDKKLRLSPDTATLVREQVKRVNVCTWCIDAGRWYAVNKRPRLIPKLDALHEYQTNTLFTDAERAALDFATELTEHKHVRPGTFMVLARHYSEREICEIVWLVSSEHLYNINNLGLGIGSDGLCQISNPPKATASGAAQHSI
jgi:alkylhydroperoxidase family enzyme